MVEKAIAERMRNREIIVEEGRDGEAKGERGNGYKGYTIATTRLR